MLNAFVVLENGSRNECSSVSLLLFYQLCTCIFFKKQLTSYQRRQIMILKANVGTYLTGKQLANI